jgi:phosphatidylglycerophosphatase C
METLVLFDFDGTLYKKDSLLEFTKFIKSNLDFILGLLFISPYFIAMKLGIITNQKAKQKYISFYFKGSNYNIFRLKGIEFALQKIEKDLDVILLKELKKHLKNKNQIYIVTASLTEWIQPWANQYKIKVIGTKIETKNNLITGFFLTKNCFGKEKVSRINEVINIKKFDSIIVYGSGKGDKEMLQLAR